jgi:hypothetical protein
MAGEENGACKLLPDDAYGPQAERSVCTSVGTLRRPRTPSFKHAHSRHVQSLGATSAQVSVDTFSAVFSPKSLPSSRVTSACTITNGETGGEGSARAIVRFASMLSSTHGTHTLDDETLRQLARTHHPERRWGSAHRSRALSTRPHRRYRPSTAPVATPRMPVTPTEPHRIHQHACDSSSRIHGQRPAATEGLSSEALSILALGDGQAAARCHAAAMPSASPVSISTGLPAGDMMGGDGCARDEVQLLTPQSSAPVPWQVECANAALSPRTKTAVLAPVKLQLQPRKSRAALCSLSDSSRAQTKQAAREDSTSGFEKLGDIVNVCSHKEPIHAVPWHWHGPVLCILVVRLFAQSQMCSSVSDDTMTHKSRAQ